MAVFKIFGNAGVGLAQLNYFGTSTGSVQADSAGSYVIPSLNDGSIERVYPVLNGSIFQPEFREVNISGGNVINVNFTRTSNMGKITPVVSNSQALITPGWPLASVPASNPIAGNPGTTPGMNTTDATDLYNAAVQAGNQSNSVA